MVRRTAAIAAALGLAVFGAACGSSEKTADEAADTAAASTPAASSSAAATDAASSDAAATDAGSSAAAPAAGAAKKGGILKMSINEALDQWDGQAYYGKQWQMEYLTLNCLVDPLPGVGEDPATLIPALATEIPAPSADGTEYVFTIRDGITYSDGTPVQAQDVKDYMERVLNPSMGYDGALGSGYYSIIQGVDEFAKADEEGNPAPDRAKEISGITVAGNQVTFKLVEPNPDFLSIMSLRFICPQKPGGPTTRSNTPEPGTGPYVISEASDSKVVWERNPSWDANAAAMGYDKYSDQLWNLDGIELTVGTAPEQSLLQLKNNEIDMNWGAEAVATLAQRKEIENDPALKARFFPNLDPFVRYVSLNQSFPPFDNLKVRQAVNYAIDRTELVTITGDGFPWSQILSGALTGNTDQVFPETADAEKAKALIAESGADISAPINLQFSETPPSPDLAAAIKGKLEAIGFKVNLVQKPAAGYYTFCGDPKNKSHMCLAGWAPDWPDGGASFGPLLSSKVACTSQNLACVKDPDLDAKMAEISKMPYGPERSAAWAELSKSYAADQTPWAVYKNGEELNLVSERTKGFAYDPVHLVNMAALYIDEG